MTDVQILGMAGGIIVFLLGIIGFFVIKVISAVAENTSNIGKNKGQIELVRLQQENDVIRIEQNTQLEIQQLGKDVQALTTSLGKHSDSVNTLIKTLIEKNK